MYVAIEDNVDREEDAYTSSLLSEPAYTAGKSHSWI